MNTLKLTFSVFLLCLSVSAQAAVTSFTVVDSSDTSWVARGLENYTIDESLGWTFDVTSGFDNSVMVNLFGPAVDGTDIDFWFMTFAAPNGETLQPGLYEDFQRYPFQDADRAGLEFGSTGRLDNMASGDFTILEISFDPSGAVLSFAADFIHFGETNPDNWALVELRYNATASPVPVPAAVWLFGSAFVGLIGVRRRA